LLAAYGIPLAEGFLVGTVEEAGAVAERLAGRKGGGTGHGACAVKLISALHTHKSDKGFVRLGLENRLAVEAACRDMLARLEPGESYEGLLVQHMIPIGRELILGAQIDGQFGPIVAFGPGGVLVDLLGGVDFLAAPFSRSEALAFIGRNAASPLLACFRGTAAAKLDTLAGCLVSMGSLIAENADRIVSVDINPFDGTLIALDFRAEGRSA
jgi:acetyltransferase